MPNSLLDAPKISRHELADKLAVSPISIDRYVRVGLRGHRLPRLRIGGRSYYLVDDVERWLRLTGDHDPGHDAAAAADHDAAMDECKALGL